MDNFITTVKMPCLKAGEHNYTFTPEELSELLRNTFYDGFKFAKDIYKQPGQKMVNYTLHMDIAKETNHGTD